MGARVPGIRLTCTNVVPHARGLGSSSAAIVAGVSVARGLVGGGSLLLDDDALFALAADLEGHPDNVAPAMYGGFTVAWRESDRFRATALAVASPVIAFPLALGVTDPPVIALTCLALAWADRGKVVRAALVLAAACAMIAGW